MVPHTDDGISTVLCFEFSYFLQGLLGDSHCYSLEEPGAATLLEILEKGNSILFTLHIATSLFLLGSLECLSVSDNILVFENSFGYLSCKGKLFSYPRLMLKHMVICA